jgi:hypothetical protein
MALKYPAAPPPIIATTLASDIWRINSRIGGRNALWITNITTIHSARPTPIKSAPLFDAYNDLLRVVQHNGRDFVHNNNKHVNFAGESDGLGGGELQRKSLNQRSDNGTDLIMSNVMLCLVLAALPTFLTAGDTPCVKWGNTFDVSLESSNVIRNCNLPDGRQICCAAISNSTATRGVGASYVPTQQTAGSTDNGKSYCTVTKVYISSPQELRELAEADRIDSIPGDKSLYMIEARSHALLSYVTSDEYIRNSTIWLDRVKVHMSSAENIAGTAADREFLSRFEFTRTCSDRATVDVVTKWTEWIEPIGITARHPFGFGKCRPAAPYYNANGEHNKSGKTKPRVGRSDVDYVLLQSGAALHEHTHAHTGRRFRSAKYSGKESRGSNNAGGGSQAQPKHYMFDAGTSTFDSSLFWFTCAYSQVRSSRFIVGVECTNDVSINTTTAVSIRHLNVVCCPYRPLMVNATAWCELRPSVRVGDDPPRAHRLLAPRAPTLEALLALPQHSRAERRQPRGQSAALCQAARFPAGFRGAWWCHYC